MAGFVFFSALLFVLAGRIDYWQGWVFIAVSLGFLVLTLFIFRKNPEFIAERLKPGPGVKKWDRVYMTLAAICGIAMAVLAPLDAARFRWSRVPAGLYAAAVMTYIAGQSIFLWAKTANRFFSSMVRIQTDRGHTVCRGGPYKVIRHPGYVGGLLYQAAMPVLLGSLWGLVPQGIACLALIVRTALEDKTLQRELPGYADYAKEVRFRLIPGIW